MVQYDSKVELIVLMTLKDLGEASIAELSARLKEQRDIDLSVKVLTRYVRRWKKRKVIAANMIGKTWVYSLRDIPWWPEAQMIHIVKPDISDVEAKDWLDNYYEELKNRGYISKREPDIKDYVSFEVTFETIDPIAGGWQTVEENLLGFPVRPNGEYYIPRNWLKGYHRWNVRLLNVNESFARDRMAYSTGEFIEQPKLTRQTRIGKNGPCTYETIPAGTQFTFTIRIPTQGSNIKGKEQLIQLYHLCEIAPLKAFGAYASAFGGRVKLANLQPIK